jgi:hypothetical protein
MRRRRLKQKKIEPMLVEAFGSCTHDIVLKPSNSTDFADKTCKTSQFKSAGVGTFTAKTTVLCNQIAMAYSRRKVSDADIAILKSKVFNSLSRPLSLTLAFYLLPW